MKFLCDNCKAKYQIPDEKIAGRTLRMNCRKCGSAIVIKGPPAEPGARRTAGPATGRRRGRSSVTAPKRRASSSRHSALGAEFRKSQTLAHQSTPPTPGRAGPEWHVAINDVPVGPIRREEVARKIGAGAVDETSLCWREGFDDWRPLGEVAELASLLDERRPKAPPRTPPPPRPAAGSNVIPIGGRRGASAAPALGDLSAEDVRTPPAAVLAPPPAPAAALARAAEPSMADLPIGAPLGESVPPAAMAADPFATSSGAISQPPVVVQQPRNREMPVGAWIAIVGAGAFGIALAVVIGPKLIADDEPERVAMATPAEAAPAAAPALPAPSAPAPEPAAVPEAAPAEDPAAPAPAPAHGSGRTHARGATMHATAGAAAPASSMSGANLSAEQRALLERLGGGTSSAAPSSLMVAEAPRAAMTSRRPLEASAISRVVNNERSQLQRCYETAIRGQSQPPRVRMDISINIGASGTVTRVNAAGNDVGGLKRCIESRVRRWRFPASSDGAETRFPMVFSAGG